MTELTKKTNAGLLARFGRNILDNPSLYLLTLLPLAYLIIFKYVPLYGVQIAFRDYNPARSMANSPWVGLRHFSRFFSYYRFWEIMKNTIVINFYGLLVFPLPIVFAMLLNYSPIKSFKKTLQMVSYAPHFISTVLMVGMILQFFDRRLGVINLLIQLLGFSPVSFLSNPKYFIHIYVWTGVWQGIGYSSIIYIAALSGVSPELHEAAIVDGASIMRRIIHIDIPSITPTISLLLILNLGSIMNLGYEKILLMQNNLNITVSEVISTYVYKQGIASAVPQYSYATAINLFVSLINIIFLLTANKIVAKLTDTGLW
ncbi:MAG: ABC transporter permease [Christensenellales bacterium]